MGEIMNEFVLNSNIWPALVVFDLILLPVFSYFYNRLMDHLKPEGAREHLSLYVVGGVLVTLIGVGIFSWKAALLCLACFALTGPFMIYGEFKRTGKKKDAKKPSKQSGRKRLPYAAKGCIEDALDTAKEAHRLLGVAYKNNGKCVESLIPMTEASHQLTTTILKLTELKVIQLGDE